MIDKVTTSSQVPISKDSSKNLNTVNSNEFGDKLQQLSFLELLDVEEGSGNFHQDGKQDGEKDKRNNITDSVCYSPCNIMLKELNNNIVTLNRDLTKNFVNRDFIDNFTCDQDLINAQLVTDDYNALQNVFFSCNNNLTSNDISNNVNSEAEINNNFVKCFFDSTQEKIQNTINVIDDEFLTQVINYIEEYNSFGNSYISFQLEPETLGEIHVYMQFDKFNDKNQVRIFANSQQVVDLLKEGKGSLLNSFNNIGINMKDIDFDLSYNRKFQNVPNYNKKRYRLFMSRKTTDNNLDILL